MVQDSDLVQNLSITTTVSNCSLQLEKRDEISAFHKSARRSHAQLYLATGEGKIMGGRHSNRWSCAKLHWESLYHIQSMDLSWCMSLKDLALEVHQHWDVSHCGSCYRKSPSNLAALFFYIKINQRSNKHRILSLVVAVYPFEGIKLLKHI